MDKKNTDSTLFTKWISGKPLSEHELNELKSSEDLDSYQRILNEVDTWTLPGLKTATFTAIENKTLNSTKVIPLYKRRSFLAAASLLLIMGLFSIFHFTNNDITITTLSNQTKTIQLIDGSKITLNENSSVSYTPQNWQDNRNIQLKGNAYFEVETGNDFTVTFVQGQVKVLGTRFEIIADESLFTSFCYEGKVATKPTDSNLDIILTKGMGVIKQDGQTVIQYLDEAKTSPRWLEDSSKNYINTSLAEVLHDLKNSFNIEIETNINLDRKFTGTFDKTNLKTALKMICLPLNIKYQIISEKKVILH